MDPQIRKSLIFVVGRVRVFGIATFYGLGGCGIEPRWAWDLPHPTTPTLGPM